MSAAPNIRTDEQKPAPWPSKPTKTLEELLPELVHFFERQQATDVLIGQCRERARGR